MGMNIACVLYLQEKGFLTPQKNKMLDIGPQNVYFCTADQVRQVVRSQNAVLDEELLQREAQRLEYFSTPRPGERTTLFSEIAELAGIDYHAFDVCPAPKTDLLDLNFETLPEQHRERYDVVLNFGTTEHIFNQWNSFTVIHDATKVDGVIYCVLPATGYLDHGYFCYTPLFFKDMIAANEYAVVDQFFAPAGQSVTTELNIDFRADGQFTRPQSDTPTPDEARIRNLNFHVIMRKTKSAPFRCALEVATAHSELDRSIAERYNAGHRKPSWRGEFTNVPDELAHLVRECNRLESEKEARIRERDAYLTERDEARAQISRLEHELRTTQDDNARFQDENARMKSSRSWRWTAPMRSLRSTLRGR